MRKFISLRTVSIAVLTMMLMTFVAPCCRVYAAEPAPELQIAGGPEAMGQKVTGPAMEIFIKTAAEGKTLTGAPVGEEDIDVLIAATKDILSDSFGDDYKIDVSENLITISLWSDGIAYASVYAIQDDGYKDDWNSLLSSLQGMSKMVYEVYEPYGYSVAVNVLNDLNKDNVLISYMNGVLIYDTVTEVDL